MRNLKRVLSMVLALAMLLGMVTTGVGAAETTVAEVAPEAVTVDKFKDVEQITYIEEVSIMAGMGLFAGTTDGKFDPLGTVTRAQMVTVLVKALRGNDFNANAFKGGGVNPFSDTAVFEGGWAEGYITAGYQMGIVGGYGDGTFKPGKAVTTAEALTMIINALKVDAGEGEWPATIMAKAEEMKLYGNLKTKPATNDPMNREQLAVVTFEGMCYSPKGVSGYKVPGVDIVFTEIIDAIRANGGMDGITEVVGEDALANEVYTLKIAKGFVTANQDTGFERTTICPVNGDGMLDTGVEFFVQTDLDMIGHYVTVYYKEAYKNAKEPGQVYTIVDETTVVEVKETIATSTAYKAAFERNYQLKDTNKVVLFDGEYNPDGIGGVSYTDPNTSQTVSYEVGSRAPVGTYFIVDNAVAGYMEPVTRYASYIVDVNKYEGSEGVLIAGENNEDYIPNAAGQDRIVEYRGMVTGDYIVYSKVQDVYVLELVNPIQGSVTKIAPKEVNGVQRDVITLDDMEFIAFDGVNNNGNKLSYDISTINYEQTYEVYVTDDDEFVGFKSVGDIAVGNIVYVLGVLPVTQINSYGDQVTEYKARCIDMNAKESLIVIGKELPDSNSPGGQKLLGISDTTLSRGFYSVKDHTNRDAKKEGIKALTPVTNAYDGKGGLFVSSASKGTITSFSSNGWGNVKSEDGLDAYGKPSSKYIFIDGNLNSPFELDVQIADSLSKYSDFDKMDLLLSRNENGITNDVEVMVIYGVSASVVNSSDSVYVSAQQLRDVERTSEGYVYNAYTTVDGAPTRITVKDPLADIGSAFYSVLNQPGELPVLTALGHNAAVGTSNYTVYQNQAIQGFVQGRTIVGFNVDDANGNVGHTLEWNASSSVVVVDTRTQEEVDESKTGLITSIDQLSDLVARDPSRVVIADVFWETPSGNKNIKSLYIKEVLYGTPGLNTVLTCTGTPAPGGEDVVMTVVSSVTGRTAGSTIKVDYDRVLYPSANGKYRYAIDASGKPVLEAIAEQRHEHTCDHGHLDSAVVAEDWKPLSGELSKFVSGGLPLAAGHYYLDRDITLPNATGTDGKLSNHIQVNGDVTICLNGNTLNSGNGQQYIIHMSGAYTLDICDCSAEQDGAITGLTMGSQAGSTFAPLIVRAGSTVNLYSGTITGNTGHAGVYVANAANAVSTFNMYGGKIVGNEIIATSQGAVHVASGTFNMYGGEISGNEIAAGVKQVTGSGDIKIDGGTVVEPVYTVTVGAVSNGTLTVNKTSGEAGDTVTVTATPAAGYELVQILVDGEAIGGNTFTITGDHTVTAEFVVAAVVSHDHNCGHTGTNHDSVAATDWKRLSRELAASGTTTLPAGHYYLDKDITLPASTLNHIKITGNTTICLNGHTLDSVGGQQFVLWLQEAYTLDICDCSADQSGKITGMQGNTAAQYAYTYAAVSARAKGTVNLYGGTITGNSAGAAVFVAANSTFNMYGGKITNNTITSADQGAVHTQDNTATFNMYGGEISGNTVAAGITQVTGAFKNDGGTVAGTVYELTAGTCTNGSVALSKTSGVAYEKITVSATPAAGYDLVRILVDGEPITGDTFTITGNHTVTAEFATGVVVGHAHDCGHTGTNHGSVAAAAWKPLSEELAASGITQLSAGHYYLDANITLPTTTVSNGVNVNHILVNGNATICLNGHTLNAGEGKDYIIKMNGAYTLDICDCSAEETGKITGLTSGTNSTYSAVIVRGGSTVNLYGGTITGNKSRAGVYVANATGAPSTFNMYGGKIVDNVIDATTQGAVHVQTGTFNMYGGEISGNEVANQVTTASGTFNKVGGTITEYVPSTYTVTVGAVSNGTVTVNKESGAKNEVVTVNATAAAGYRLKQILVDGVAIPGNTFTITGNHTVTAEFAKLYTMTAGTCENGTVTLDKYSGVEGETVKVTATHATGYKLVKILKDGEEITGDTFTISGDHTITAVFEANGHSHTDCGKSHSTPAGDWTALEQSTFASGAYALNGHYYLKESIQLPEGVSLSIAADTTVTICLSGKTLTGNANPGYAIKIEGGGKLHICDCTGNGKVVQSRTGALSTDSGTVIVTGSNSEFNLHAGTIEGGVVLNGNTTKAATFNMYGGTVKAVDGNDVVFAAKNKAATINIVKGTLAGATGDAEIVVESATNSAIRVRTVKATGCADVQVSDDATTYKITGPDSSGNYTLEQKT